MSYDFAAFCADIPRILKPKGTDGLGELATKLRQLLANRDFVAATFNDDMPPGKRVLFQDPETGVYVQAHIQAADKRGSPHSHGNSWAIYGNARGFTDMTEWRRINPAHEDHAVLEVAEQYRLAPGDARPYPPGTIHSTQHPQVAWVIRVTGCDLDNIARYRFDKTKDRIVETAPAS